MPAHPPLSTLADAAVASNGTCHCSPEWHNFPVKDPGFDPRLYRSKTLPSMSSIRSWQNHPLWLALHLQWFYTWTSKATGNNATCTKVFSLNFWWRETKSLILPAKKKNMIFRSFALIVKNSREETSCFKYHSNIVALKNDVCGLTFSKYTKTKAHQNNAIILHMNK